MKAKDLKKTSETIDNIHNRISECNADGDFKCFIPHFKHVSEEVKLQLMKDGFKVYIGDWDGMIKDCLIIEW